MELGRVDPPLFDRGRELDPVLAPRRAKGRAPRTPVRLPQATLGLSRARGRRYDRVIGVDEVEMGARRDALEEAQLPRVLDAVPTHMRNLPARREPPYHPRDHVEAARLSDRPEVAPAVIDNGDHRLASPAAAAAARTATITDSPRLRLRLRLALPRSQTHRAPFVDGTIPAMRGFTRVASASARPTALNTASVTWWRLWP